MQAQDSTVAGDEKRVPISSAHDLVAARQQGRTLAVLLGFSSSESTLIATAISELARNILTYAGQGEIILRPNGRGDRTGLLIIARDDGPGIADVNAAMQPGYSTSHGLGLGLPGVRRIVDELDVISSVGKGTTVTVKKWKR